MSFGQTTNGPDGQQALSSLDWALELSGSFLLFLFLTLFSFLLRLFAGCISGTFRSGF